MKGLLFLAMATKGLLFLATAIKGLLFLATAIKGLLFLAMAIKRIACGKIGGKKNTEQEEKEKKRERKKEGEGKAKEKKGISKLSLYVTQQFSLELCTLDWIGGYPVRLPLVKFWIVNDLGFSSTLEVLLRFSCGAMAMAIATAITVMVTVTVTLGLLPASGAIAATSRPDPSDSPAMARWLASQSDWGVLSTISIHLKGTPWGNVASFSDGPVGSSGGTPFFYLSKMDPTPNDIESDPRCSLSLSEAPLGSCGGVDTENPTCARLTLSGKMKEVTEKQELDFAAQALFSRHPEMPAWPKWHKWVFYKLEIEDIFLIDYYGGAKPITIDEYYRGSVQAAVAR